MLSVYFRDNKVLGALDELRNCFLRGVVLGFLRFSSLLPIWTFGAEATKFRGWHTLITHCVWGRTCLMCPGKWLALFWPPATHILCLDVQCWRNKQSLNSTSSNHNSSSISKRLSLPLLSQTSPQSTSHSDAMKNQGKIVSYGEEISPMSSSLDEAEKGTPSAPERKSTGFTSLGSKKRANTPS